MSGIFLDGLRYIVGRISTLKLSSTLTCLLHVHGTNSSLKEVHFLLIKRCSTSLILVSGDATAYNFHFPQHFPFLFLAVSFLIFFFSMSFDSLTFVEAIQKWHKVYENDIAGTFISESATRAVLMMIYSPCKYIASKARFILSEILKSKGLEYLNILLRFLNNLSSGNFAITDNRQIIIYLMGFICYSRLEEYEVWIIKQKGLKTLFAFMKWCLSNHFQVERLSFAPHLHNAFHEKICCSSSRDWEGKDILLLYSLLGLAELIKHSGCVGNDLDRTAGKNTLAHIEAELVSKLQDICNNNGTPGVQWYAAYVLSYFGFYGFPSNLMKRIGKAINDKDSADLQFILTNGECFSVHGVVLAIQCPSLLPPEGRLPSEITSDHSSVTGSMEISKEFQKDIRLSAHVDHQALVKLLEYIYLGYLQAEEELAKKLRTLAKRCNLQPLLQMLCRKRPKWGTAFPSPDLSAALGPSGHRFSYDFLYTLYCCITSALLLFQLSYEVCVSLFCINKEVYSMRTI